MIVLKSSRELELMKEACIISAQALQVAGEAVKPGVTTYEIDKIAYDFIKKCGATPNFLNYGGYPATACISINDEVIHGIPSKQRIIREGDIVSVDVGALYDGFNGDNCATFGVGKISDEAKKLLEVTQASLYEGISKAVVGNRIGDIGHAVEEYCASRGYGIVREYCGHGIGRELHESPDIPNYGKPGHGPRLMAGMTICIEPMINQGGDAVRVLNNGWTVVTRDGSLSAHFEHQIAITAEGPVILTNPD